MNRGNLTLKILNFLEEAAAATGAILDLFLTDRTTSYRLARGLPVKRIGEKKSNKETLTQIEKHRLYNILSWLKRDGLIKKSERGIWFITPKGKDRKDKLITRKSSGFPAFGYNIEKSDHWIIVTFDIPEKEKRKRVWLRSILKNFGFRMLQKSVWIGKVKLPEEFINDIKRLNLLAHVEILAITKSGSLRSIEN